MCSKLNVLTLALLTGLVFAVACSREASTGPDVPDPTLQQAGNSGCYTVNFTVNYTEVMDPSRPFTFEGVVSGDLEGSAELIFDTAVRSTRSTFTALGVVTYEITGGLITELVGQSFQTRLRTLNVFPDDGDPLVARNNVVERALSGVSKANLTIHGLTDIPSPQTPDWIYHGVICP